MTKAESRTAAKDGWQVRDDFGAIGKVVAVRDEETVLVKWDGEDDAAPVHHNRIERT
jgi:hypothetical protein